MGSGLRITKKDQHVVSGSGFRSEIILANININTEVNYFRTIDPESHKQHRKRLISGISRKGRAAGKKIRRSHVQAKSSQLLLSGKHRTGRLARSSHRASGACLCALQHIAATLDKRTYAAAALLSTSLFLSQSSMRLVFSSLGISHARRRRAWKCNDTGA